MKKLTGSLPFRLLLGVVIGILVGQFAGERGQGRLLLLSSVA